MNEEGTLGGSPGEGSGVGDGQGDQQGGGGFDFKAHLPEELRNDPTIAQTKDLAGLASQVINAQKIIGSSIRLPKADASEEELEKFYARIGRPETPDAYTFTPPEGIPEGLGLNEERTKEYFGAAHKLGLTQRQAEGILSWHTGVLIKENKEQAEQRVQQLAELKKEWGADYDKRLQDANAALDKFGSEGLANLLKQTGLSADVEVIKFFDALAKSVSEDAIITGDDTPTGPSNKEEAEARISEIMDELTKPNLESKKRAELEKEKASLYERIHGKEVVATIG